MTSASGIPGPAPVGDRELRRILAQLAVLDAEADAAGPGEPMTVQFLDKDGNVTGEEEWF